MRIPYEEDRLLQQFHTNTKLHEKALAHAKEKGAKPNELSLFNEPTTWDLITSIISNGKYVTNPTEIKYIDKNTDEYITYNEAMSRNMKDVREIYVMTPFDRVVWNLIYSLLYSRFCGLINESCVSYKQGWSTQKVARELSQNLIKLGRVKGVKGDFSKYFDTVPIELIDKILDKLEQDEPSMLWKVVRDFYHDNRVIINKQLTERYGSLKQGCAFACLLANIILSDIDEEMNKFNVVYYRYSDDFIIIGRDYLKAFSKMKRMLDEKGIRLNEKKTEEISSTYWFTFLGYRFERGKVTISEKTLRKICLKVKEETVNKSNNLHRGLTKQEIETAIDNIQYYLFVGCKKHRNGMAGYLYGACNVEEDINKIDEFIKHCIMAAYTNRTQIYTLGKSYGKCGVYQHYIGKNVGSNMLKAFDIPRSCGWYSLNHMMKRYHQGKGVYKAEIRKMRNGYIVPEDVYYE